MNREIMVNPGKTLRVTVNGKVYKRIPVKTHVVMPGENLIEVVKKYTGGLLQAGDVLFITEKIVAVSQHRAYPVKEIKPRKLATFLSRFVTKTKHGIGLGIPETMEMALRECGVWRILLAAGVAAITKAFGRKGDFYRIAGYKASSIDGPTPNTIPPYNEYVVLGPDKPNKVAREVSEALGVPVLIVDLNDLGGKILGVSGKNLDRDLYYTILKDNPLGQSREQTPLGIIRLVK
ncbi:coenzyme F420-0:L-glutamate ligase [Thermospira aquatica]|uniref:Coenzyme F420-0:L-glutamate ligase n=1 Tax=Thermospira aquatica TaxID=2828656 RepID=A0AAX3BD03_9SPIR|nr:coenzyme F420-0:L-glutamate ligase [Thermospira aquatica]URA10122.1 coenzyme F420-0:L-glutamate ligase [Thermospira aquatica]